VFLELDGTGPQYAQLTRAIQNAIHDGRLGYGSRLPSTRILARELALSRTTVLAAYEQLRAEGYIDGRVGSGSYVAINRVAQPPDASAAAIAPPSRYARRARGLRNLLPAMQHYDMRYNLQYSNPLINPSLNEIWGRELAHAAAHTALEGIDPQGLPTLRQQICDYLARWRGLVVQPQDVLITSGAQQAFSLAARVLLDEGDTVVVEEPHYFGAYQAMAAHGAHLSMVRTDGEGLVCDELPAMAPRLVCVTPSHQFPSGATMSPSRRRDLLRYAAEKHCWILEDDFDGEFRYDAQPLAPLRSLTGAERVIYVGTFAKTLFHAARMGYIVLPPALRDDFVTAKYLNDFASPVIPQAALARFMESGGFERHLRSARKELRARRTEVVEGLRHHAWRYVDLVDSDAGMYVLAWLRDYDHAAAEELIALARSRGLGLHLASLHYAYPPPRPGLMLGFARLSVAALREAMQLLGQCLDDMNARRQRAAAASWCGAARFAVS
jgi:GntR family transcriptional regulator/MocR family aminotransferase